MRRPQQFLCTLIFFLLLQTPNPAKSQTVSYTLDSMLNYALDSLKIALNSQSLNAAVQFPENISWKRATGISAINPIVNVTTDDSYLIGSITKTRISGCIL